MAFCKFSNVITNQTSTNIDNIFMTHYLPYAPDSCVKVYLLGLYRCQNINPFDNTLENFATTLNLSEEDVESAFLYWQEQGLVQLINVKPFEVVYLPIKKPNLSLKKFNKDKYENFNKEMQELLCERMISPTEYAEYYTFLESNKMEQTALIMITKYCTTLKGAGVGYNYILTVAKNWAFEGIKTAEQVEQKLNELEKNMGEIKEVLKILGIKRNASFEEHQLYLKWNKEMDFDRDVIFYVANSLKKKGKIDLLDKKLCKYFELKLFSIKEIEEFELNKENMLKTAKQITKTIGVYYENLDNVLEVYISTWLNMGFNENALVMLADFCFKNSIRTLEGMNGYVKKFYEKGLTTEDSISSYFKEIILVDEKIKEILKLVGLNRNVISFDREFFNTWTQNWNFSIDVIEYACSLANGKMQPLQYVNKILSNWKNKGISTLEQAKLENGETNSQNVKQKVSNPISFASRSYSQEEISALFDSLGEVKI